MGTNTTEKEGQVPNTNDQTQTTAWTIRDMWEDDDVAPTIPAVTEVLVEPNGENYVSITDPVNGGHNVVWLEVQAQYLAPDEATAERLSKVATLVDHLQANFWLEAQVDPKGLAARIRTMAEVLES